jgi:hypothetical protein
MVQLRARPPNDRPLQRLVRRQRSRYPGAHSQGATVDELRENLEEVVVMLLEDGEPKFEGEFVGTQTVKVA